MGLVEWYNHLMVDLRDPRVDSWLGMYSIWPTIIICSAYVYFVKVLGPRYFFFFRHCQVEMFALITTTWITNMGGVKNCDLRQVQHSASSPGDFS